MVRVIFDIQFKKDFKKIQDNLIKKKIIKQISKIGDNPEVGKPMRFSRKGTRELYISPFRLSYIYEKEAIIILTLYHKDIQ